MFPMPRPLLLGHRGARATRSVPENTMDSFDLAMKHGCDGFEFDVRLTQDRQAVVCHDPVSCADASQRSFTVAQAHRNDLPHLPILGDVVSRYRLSAFLDVELKVTGLAPSVIHALGPHHANGPGLVISSFLPAALLEFHEADSLLPLGLICDTHSQLQHWQRLPLQFVIPHHKLLTQTLLQELHSASMSVLVWTVNDPRDMRRLADWGVQGIISDETELLVQTLAGPFAGR